MEVPLTEMIKKYRRNKYGRQRRNLVWGIFNFLIPFSHLNRVLEYVISIYLEFKGEIQFGDINLGVVRL